MRPFTFFLLLLATRIDATGTDVTNNLFSDLGPLLALFGEQFARQFLRESFTWLDHIIFAMAPLGIITAIVGAIRVGGFPWLKAMVGRARENRASAELELMSSTSHEVCELWNGDGIVRTTGKGMVKQIVFLEGCGDPEQECYLFTLTHAQDRHMKKEVYRGPFLKQLPFWKTAPSEKSTDRKDPLDRAPNISLNLHSKKNMWELAAVAFLGTVLQSGVIVFSGFVAYNRRFGDRVGGRPSSYAFPVLTAGTAVLTLGMWICALVIGQSTEEFVWEVEEADLEKGSRGKTPATRNTGFHVFWLQRSFVVSDQSFPSFMLMAKDPKTEILTSCRNNDPVSAGNTSKSDMQLNSLWLNTLSLVGTVTGISGFILQFEGFRGISWACSIAQLVAILIMTFLRALVRRGMLDSPTTKPVPAKYEMDWLALRIGYVPNYLPTLSSSEHRPKHTPKKSPGQDNNSPPELFWKVCNKIKYPSTGNWEAKTKTDRRPAISEKPGHPGYPREIEGKEKEKKKAQAVVNIRKRLGELTKWPNPSSYATSVATVIGKVMDLLFHESQKETFVWDIDVQVVSEVSDEPAKVRLTAERKPAEKPGEKSPWIVSKSDIESIISLWMYHFNDRDKTDEARDKAPQGNTEWVSPTRTPYRRVLGPSNPIIKRDLAWWAGAGVAEALEDIEWDRSEKSLDLGFECQDTSKLPASGSGSLYCAMIADVSLEKFLAQHIFSTFMWAIASSIRIPWNQSATTVEPQSEDRFNAQVPEWNSLRLINPLIQQMARAVEGAALGSLEDAHVLIVTPLSLSNKLPNEGLVEVVRKKARDNERDYRLDRACDAYIKLLDLCEGLPLDEKFVYTVVATAVDFLVTPMSAPVTDDHGETLGKTKMSLVKALKSKHLQCLFDLRDLYAKQHRDNHFDKALLWKIDASDLKKNEKGKGDPTRSRRDPKDIAEKIFGHTTLHRKIIDSSDDIDEYLKDLTKDLDVPDILGWTPLHYAVIYSQKVVSTLASRNAELAAKTDLAGRTPLHYAVMEEKEGVLDSLLDASPKPQKGRDGLFPLHWAAKLGNSGATILLLKQQLHRDNVNTGDYWGMTPLHFAASGGHLDIVKLLFNARPSTLDRQDHFERTALHIAIKGIELGVVEKRGQAKVVEELLKSGANFRLKNKEGETALQLAAHYELALGNKKISREISKKPRGAQSKKIGTKDAEGSGNTIKAVSQTAESALTAVRKRGEGANKDSLDSDNVFKTHPQDDLNTRPPVAQGGEKVNEAMLKMQTQQTKLCIRYLLEKENLATDGGRLLLWAAQDKLATPFSILMEKEGKVKYDELDPTTGRSVLHFAADAGFEEMATQILERWTPHERETLVDLSDVNGTTALLLAASRGYKSIIEKLVEFKADIEVKDQNQRTPLSWAAENGHAAAVKELLIRGARPDVVDGDPEQSILARVAKNGNVAVASLLMEGEHGATLGLRGASDQTTTSIAISNGRTTIVQLFLDKGADPNGVNSVDGYTFLCDAVIFDQKEIAKLLLDKGANIERPSGSYDRTPLSLAASNGNCTIIGLLLDEQANIESKDSDGRTPLMLAAWFGHLDAVTLLINNGAKFSVANNDKDSALSLAADGDHKDVIHAILDEGLKTGKQQPMLHLESTILWASKIGDQQIVEKLLNLGTNVDVKNTTGSTPLMEASKEGNLDVFKLLLDHGADAEQTNSELETPLHCASFKGSEDTVSLLLEKHVQIDARTQSKSTALLLAVQEGHEGVAKLLLKAGADPNAENDAKETPLYWACNQGSDDIVQVLLSKHANTNPTPANGSTPLLESIDKQNTAISMTLLSNKARFDVCDRNGWSALNLASWHGDFEVVKKLIELGADITSTDGDSDTPLHEAAHNGHLEIAKLLIDKGAKVESMNYYMSSPLHYAASNGCEDVVKLLLERGAPLDSPNRGGRTPLSRAAGGGYGTVIKLLCERGAQLEFEDSDRRTPLSLATENGDEAAVKQLIQLGASVKSKDKKGRTPLSWAASSGHVTVVQQFLDPKSPEHLLSRDINGSIPLMWAASYSYEAIVNLLLDDRYSNSDTVQAQIKAQNSLGSSTLHFAARSGSEEIIQKLLDENIDQNTKDTQGINAIHEAANRGHITILKILIDRGLGGTNPFDPVLRDKQGRNALHHAPASESEAVVSYLLELCPDQAQQQLPDSDGWTPLHWAAQAGSLEVVQKILDSGADAKVREKLKNWSPRQIARYNGYDEIVELLSKISDPDEKDVLPGTKHEGIGCDGCFCLINGIRFKCMTCYNFDFCEKCMHSAAQTHLDHKFDAMKGTTDDAQKEDTLKEDAQIEDTPNKDTPKDDTLTED